MANSGAAPDAVVTRIGTAGDPSGVGYDSTTAAAIERNAEVFSAVVSDTYQRELNLFSNLAGLAHVENLRGRGKSYTHTIDGQDNFTAGQGVQVFEIGEEREGRVTWQDTVTVNIDEMVEDTFEIGIEDKAREHTNIIENKAPKLAFTLASDKERKGFQILAKACFEPANSRIHPGGTNIVKTTGVASGYSAITSDAGDTATSPYSNDDTGAAAFIRDVSNLARQMTQKFVPEMGRQLYVAPEIIEILQNNTSIFDADLSNRPNRLNERAVAMLSGFEVITTTNFPTGDLSTATDANPDSYRANFTVAGNAAATQLAPGGIAALAVHRSPARPALLCGEMFDIETLFIPAEASRRKADFYNAYTQYGMSILHPECVGGIFVKDTVA